MRRVKVVGFWIVHQHLLGHPRGQCERSYDPKKLKNKPCMDKSEDEEESITFDPNLNYSCQGY